MEKLVKQKTWLNGKTSLNRKIGQMEKMVKQKNVKQKNQLNEKLS